MGARVARLEQGKHRTRPASATKRVSPAVSPRRTPGSRHTQLAPDRRDAVLARHQPEHLEQLLAVLDALGAAGHRELSAAHLILAHPRAIAGSLGWDAAEPQRGVTGLLL